MRSSAIATWAGTIWLTIGAALADESGWMVAGGFFGLILIWWGYRLRGEE